MADALNDKASIEQRRLEAVRDLERVLVLVRILPLTCLEWLDPRAASLEAIIRQCDEALSRLERPVP